MKKYIVFLFIVSAWTSFGQKTFVIEGKVRNFTPGSRIQLYRWYDNMGEKIGEDTLQNGTFVFQGDVDAFPARMSLFIEGDSLYYGERTLWIGEPLTRVTGNGYYVGEWKVKSRLKLQREENRFVRKTASISREFENLIHKKQKEYIAELRDSRNKSPKMTHYPVLRLFDSLSLLSSEANFRVLKKQAVVSAVGMERLYTIARGISSDKKGPISQEMVEELYSRLDPALKSTSRANEIYNYISPVKVVEIGAPMADDVPLFDPSGKEHRLTEYKGKYILLDFWSQACGPCIMAQPELEEVMEKFPDKLQVLSISLDVSEKAWKKAIAGLKGTHLNDFKGEGGLIARYGFDGIPKFVIIDPQGKVVDKWTGYRKGIFEDRLKVQWKENGGKNK